MALLGCIFQKVLWYAIVEVLWYKYEIEESFGVATSDYFYTAFRYYFQQRMDKSYKMKHHWVDFKNK